MYYSIGSDCHPAMVLKHLNLRRESSPFDWLDTKCISVFEYFHEHIITDFKYFLYDLEKNERSQPYSKKYPKSIFLHDLDIIENNNVNEKYVKRIQRLQHNYNNSACVFVCNIKSNSILSHSIVSKLYVDCSKIINNNIFITNRHNLYIYIRYDEDFTENEQYCNSFYTKIKQLTNNNVVINKYCRNFKKDGIWGDNSKYSLHFKDLLSLQERFKMTNNQCTCITFT